MDFGQYQLQSRRTAKYPPIGHGVIYPTLGLTNEAGVIGEAEREALKGELGDVLWYLAQVCTELDLSLDEVAEYNLKKLLDRLERGKIGGDGDNR